MEKLCSTWEKCNQVDGGEDLQRGMMRWLVYDPFDVRLW